MEAASLRERLAEETELAVEQISELEARAGAAVAERDALLDQARILHTCGNLRAQLR